MADPLAVIEPLDVPDGVGARVRGEIDMSNVDSVFDTLSTLFGHATVAYLELSETRYIDSQGLHMLTRLADALAMHGGELVVAAPADTPAGQLLALVQMTDHLRVVTS